MANDGSVDPLAVVLFVNDGHSEHVAALRVAGYRVELAASAVEALTQGRALRPDALIVPLSMPGGHGADLADRIGSAERTLAVVILGPADTASASQDGPVAAGAAFCDLPCSPGDLVALVGKQLAARKVLGHSPTPPSAR